MKPDEGLADHGANNHGKLLSDPRSLARGWYPRALASLLSPNDTGARFVPAVSESAVLATILVSARLDDVDEVLSGILQSPRELAKSCREFQDEADHRVRRFGNATCICPTA
jgi:hypothetical protein